MLRQSLFPLTIVDPTLAVNLMLPSTVSTLKTYNFAFLDSTVFFCRFTVLWQPVHWAFDLLGKSELTMMTMTS